MTQPTATSGTASSLDLADRPRRWVEGKAYGSTFAWTEDKTCRHFDVYKPSLPWLQLDPASTVKANIATMTGLPGRTGTVVIYEFIPLNSNAVISTSAAYAKATLESSVPLTENSSAHMKTACAPAAQTETGVSADMTVVSTGASQTNAPIATASQQEMLSAGNASMTAAARHHVAVTASEILEPSEVAAVPPSTAVAVQNAEPLKPLKLTHGCIVCPDIKFNTHDIASSEELRAVRTYALHDQPLMLNNSTLVDMCLTMGYFCSNDKPRFNRLRKQLVEVIHAFPENGPWKEFAQVVDSLQRAARNYRACTGAAPAKVAEK